MSSSLPPFHYYPVVNDHYYGLLVRRQAMTTTVGWAPLPLTSVDVQAQVFDFCSEVTVTQTYHNRTSFNLESEYIFPLDENSAVCGFKAELNGRIINGLVKEKEEAKREFQQAKAAGQSTMLLEQKQENVFKISIGNLNANTECKITLTYITTLDLEGKSNRFVVPAVVAPKYEPFRYFGGRTGDDFNGTTSATLSQPVVSSAGTMNFFQSMTNQYMGTSASGAPVSQPEPTATLAVKQVHAEAQRFTMSIELLMPSEILSITSETHQDQLTITIDPLQAPPNAEGRLTIPQHARVTFGKNADGTEAKPYPETLGAKDFILKITQKVYLEARAVLEVDPTTGSQAVQLAFCPETIDIMDASSLQVEILFLIDQSGSMGGESIQSVKACLDIFLRSLPVVCKFNLISFGSYYHQLFPTSQLYSETSIAEALTYVQKIDADLGGTEILGPLRHCLSEAKDVAYPRQVFLLTDGQVSNVQELIDLTRQYANNARLFTFGLGSGVDRHLVKSLATAGRGECEFITGNSTPEAKQELNSKIMRNLIKAMQPSLQDIKIDWSQVGGEKIGQSAVNAGKEFFAAFTGASSSAANASTAIANIPAQQTPEAITPIFPPNRELIYALGVRAPIHQASASGQDQIVNIKVTAHSNRPNSSDGKSRGLVEWNIPVNLSKIQQGTFIHKLAARARISEIQNWTKSHNYYKDQKSEVLKLAIPYQLLSNYTAFIIVDDRKPDTHVEKEALKNAQLDMFNAFANTQMSGAAAKPAAVQPLAQSQPQQQQQQQVFYGYATMDTSSPPVSGGSVPSPYPSSSSASYAISAPPPPPPSVSVMDFALNSSILARRASDCDDDEAKEDMLSSLAPPPADRSFNGPIPSPSPSTAPMAMGPPAPMMFGGGGSSAPPSVSAKLSVASAPSVSRSSVAAPMLRARMSDMGEEREVAPQREMKMKKQSSSPTLAPVAASSAMRGGSAPSNGSANSGVNATEANKLFTSLTQMVAIDGTWQLTDELLTLMKSAVNATGQSSEIKTAISSLTIAGLTTLANDKLKLQTKAVGTLLALWIFSVCFGQRQSEWMMMVGKSKGALRSTLSVPIDQIDTITKQIVGV